MTGHLNPIGRSPLGTAKRSQLGVLTRGFDQCMVLVFIDESGYYEGVWGLENWNTDKDHWLEFVAHNEPPYYGVALCHLPTRYAGSYYYEENIWRTPVPGITRHKVRRPPTFDEIKSVFNDIRPEGILPPLVRILVDNSGSTVRSDLLPGLDEFEAWLDDGGPTGPGGPAIEYEEWSLGSEQWLFRVTWPGLNYIVEE